VKRLALCALLVASATGAARADEAAPAAAGAGESGAGDRGALAAPLARARAREEIVARRSAEADAAARGQALFAYRLARKRTAAFLDGPDRRGSNARAADAALLVLGRSLQEAAVWEAERAASEDERRALEAAAAATNAARELPRRWQRRFRPPTRGAAVATPAVRRDEATGAETRLDGVEVLARLDEPVRAVASGEVRRVAALPQGGFAVVTAHEDGWISILSGLRQVDVAEGRRVQGGTRLGGVGRNLDGAPILGFALVRHGQPVDPAPLLARETRSVHARARTHGRHHHGR
jgi:murein hydrolase activator